MSLPFLPSRSARLLGLIAVLGLLCVSSPALPADDEVPEGFVSLFNGRNLDGWQGNAELWKVKDGVLSGISPGIDYNDFLVSERPYADFELRLEFRLHEGKGNSGIQFRSEKEPDSPQVIGYQADIGQNYWGCLYDEHRRRRILAQAPPELDQVLKKDDWNRYRIRAVGDHIELFINGLRTVDYREPDADIARRGILALQIHSGPAMQIDFRRIYLRQLKTASAN